MIHGLRLGVAILLLMLLGLPAAAQSLPLNRKQVEAALLHGSRNFYRRDLTGLDLSGLDFRQADLTEAILRRAILTNAVLAGAILDRATLAEAQLGGADLARARLVGANLTRANLRGANAQDANLAQADLTVADLREVNLQSAVLTEATLIGTNLENARLVGANLEKAKLIRVRLRGADLTRATLRRAQVVHTDFRDVLIDEARFAGAELATAQNLQDARRAETAIWEEAVPPPSGAQSVPANPVAQGPPWIARIHLRYGAPIEVEDWREEGEVFVYRQDGVAYGIPRDNVRRIEDAQGRTLREFADRMPSGHVRFGGDCTRPRIGDPVSYMDNYSRCMEKHGARVVFSQGVSAARTTEQTGSPAGAAARGPLVKRWEVRDGAGRPIEAYEAVGDSITLASEQ